MKINLLIALSFIGQMAFANFNSFTNQKQFVENHAKQTRHKLYKNGYHYDIKTTEPSVMTLEELNYHYSEKDTHDEPLSRDQYSKLFACVKSSNCNLWFYQSFSNMFGGSGSGGHFILFYANAYKPYIINHSAYVE